MENCCINGGIPVINGKSGDWTLFSYEQYRQFRDNIPGFSSLAAFDAGTNQVAVRGAPFTIVGVAPPTFYGEQLREHPPAFWLPLNARSAVGDKDSLLDHSELQWLNLIGRVSRE